MKIKVNLREPSFLRCPYCSKYNEIETKGVKRNYSPHYIDSNYVPTFTNVTSTYNYNFLCENCGMFIKIDSWRPIQPLGEQINDILEFEQVIN